MIKRILINTLLFAFPAMFVTGLSIYYGNIYLTEFWGVKVPDLLYTSVLFVSVFGAMWLTSGKLIREVSSGDKNQKEQI